MTGAPLVHHTIGIVIEDLLLKGVQGLVELQSSMTGSESGYENIGFGTFDGIVVDAGVNGFQNVVGAKAEGAEFEGGIRDESEQIGGVLNGDGGGSVSYTHLTLPTKRIV